MDNGKRVLFSHLFDFVFGYVWVLCFNVSFFLTFSISFSVTCGYCVQNVETQYPNVSENEIEKVRKKDTFPSILCNIGASSRLNSPDDTCLSSAGG